MSVLNDDQVPGFACHTPERLDRRLLSSRMGCLSEISPGVQGRVMFLTWSDDSITWLLPYGEIRVDGMAMTTASWIARLLKP